jgi:hypothetical protein
LRRTSGSGCRAGLELAGHAVESVGVRHGGHALAGAVSGVLVPAAGGQALGAGVLVGGALLAVGVCAGLELAGHAVESVGVRHGGHALAGAVSGVLVPAAGGQALGAGVLVGGALLAVGVCAGLELAGHAVESVGVRHGGHALAGAVSGVLVPAAGGQALGAGVLVGGALLAVGVCASCSSQGNPCT